MILANLIKISSLLAEFKVKLFNVYFKMGVGECFLAKVLFTPHALLSFWFLQVDFRSFLSEVGLKADTRGNV